MAVANKATLVENLLRVIAASFWGFAPQFKLIPKWDLGGICGAASSQAAPRYWQKFLPGS